jgi:hypothetical protein
MAFHLAREYPLPSRRRDMRKLALVLALLLALVMPSAVSAFDAIRLDTTMRRTDCVLVPIEGQTCMMYDCCDGNCTIIYVC